MRKRPFSKHEMHIAVSPTYTPLIQQVNVRHHRKGYEHQAINKSILKRRIHPIFLQLT